MDVDTTMPKDTKMELVTYKFVQYNNNATLEVMPEICHAIFYYILCTEIRKSLCCDMLLILFIPMCDNLVNFS